MGMILCIASSHIVGKGDIVGRSGCFKFKLSANSVMRGRVNAIRTFKGLVADLRIITGGSISGWTPGNEEEDIVINGEEINPQTNNML